MGQQQLLLLVLGIVIVGLSVVVGIQAFGENQKKANADALVSDAIRIASDAQAWKLKPAAFGGGANATKWTNFSLTQIGYTVDAESKYNNVNGQFSLTGNDATGPLVITGQSTSASGLGNYVKVGVFGTTQNCIVTVVGGSDVDDPTAPTGCTIN